MKDFFLEKAFNFDNSSRRINNASKVALEIIKEINLKKEMEILDFGAGTGLLLERIAPFVKKITAVDKSPSMVKVLNEKIQAKKIACEVEILELDFENSEIKKKFDGIISSMTMHHIQDISKLFDKSYQLLNENGFIALADLEEEDGSFHDSDTGVFHFGFKKEDILEVAKSAGFRELKIKRVNVIQKPQGNFGVFLLTGKK